MRFIGEKLKRIRAEKGITQDEAAAVARISSGYLSDLESGKKGNPRAEIVERLGKLFGVHPTYFYMDESYTLKQMAEELPGLTEEVKAFLKSDNAIEWLVVTERAKSEGIPPEILVSLINMAKKIKETY